MASIHQACGRMVVRRTGTGRTPVSARMLASSAALLEALSPNSRAPAGRPDASSCTGVRSCTPAGSIETRTGTPSGRRTRCTRHPKTFSRFAAHYPQNSRPGAFRQRRARTRRQTGRGRLSIMNTSPVATLPRRSRESRPSNRQADADDD